MGYWGLNSWFVHARKAFYQLTRLHFQPTLHRLDVAGSILCCMGGREVGHGEWRRSGKRGGFYFLLPVVFLEKNNNFRKGWWHNRNVALKKQEAL